MKNSQPCSDLRSARLPRRKNRIFFSFVFSSLTNIRQTVKKFRLFKKPRSVLIRHAVLYPVHDSNFSRSHNKNKKVTFASYKEDVTDIDYSCLAHVKTICESLPTCLQEDQTNCLGFILDHNRSSGRYSLLIVSVVLKSKKFVYITLRLQDSHIIQEIFKRLNQRLFLAVKLAFSLLRLHATPWLPENWCKKCDPDDSDESLSILGKSFSSFLCSRFESRSV